MIPTPLALIVGAQVVTLGGGRGPGIDDFDRTIVQVVGPLGLRQGACFAGEDTEDANGRIVVNGPWYKWLVTPTIHEFSAQHRKSWVPGLRRG